MFQPHPKPWDSLHVGYLFRNFIIKWSWAIVWKIHNAYLVSTVGFKPGAVIPGPI